MNFRKQINAAIKDLLHFRPKTKSTIEQSVQHYYESGKVSGDLYEALIALCNIARSQVTLYDPALNKPPYEFTEEIETMLETLTIARI